MLLVMLMLKEEDFGGSDWHLSIKEKSAHSHKNKSELVNKTLPLKLSSPSRTRDCSTNCGSAPTIYARRLSNRPRHRRYGQKI